MEEALKQLPIIYSRINDLETNHKHTNNQTVKDWIEEITDPEFQLIDNLVNLLSNSLKSSTNKERIIHILCYFLHIIDDNSIKEQLDDIGALPKILSQYIKTQCAINKEAIYIIGRIFSVETFKDVIDFEFIKQLFNQLTMTEDDELLSNTIQILIDINAFYTNIKDSVFLDVYHKHPNARLLNEVLLRLLNNETNKDKLYKILLCLSNIMDKEEKIVFYSTDLDTFIDISLVKLESTYNDELKLIILAILQKVTYYNEYYQAMYKINELTDLMEDYASNESQSKVIQNNSQKVLDNLVKHLQEKLKEVNDDNDNDDNSCDEEENISN